MKAINNLPGSEGSRNALQRLSESGFDGTQGQVPPLASGHDDDVARNAQHVPVQPVGLPQQSLDAIAPHGPAMTSPDGDSQARIGQTVGQGPDGNLAQAKDAPLAENAVKITLPAEPFPPWKSLVHGKGLVHFGTFPA